MLKKIVYMMLSSLLLLSFLALPASATEKGSIEKEQLATEYADAVIVAEPGYKLPVFLDVVQGVLPVSVMDQNGEETDYTVHVPTAVEMFDFFMVTADAAPLNPSAKCAYSEAVEITGTCLASEAPPEKLWMSKPVPGRPGSFATGWLYLYGTAHYPGDKYVYAFYRGTITCSGSGA